MNSSDTPPPKRLWRLSLVEAQQMIAIDAGFADPQLADQAAVDESVVH